MYGSEDRKSVSKFAVSILRGRLCHTHLASEKLLCEIWVVNLDVDEIFYEKKKNVITLNDLRTILLCW